MNEFETISSDIHEVFEKNTKAREDALTNARLLIRKSALTIRAAHREDFALGSSLLNEAADLADALKVNLADFPSIFFAGYTQDALKEYVEASVTFALIKGNTIPLPHDLSVGEVPYIKGLAETVGELRRRTLDILRKNDFDNAEGYLEKMEEIYAILVTMDYPDAITGGLRRLTDIVRGILERTRGDLTISIRQKNLEEQMENLANLLDQDQV